jgi:hypothetical protein
MHSLIIETLPTTSLGPLAVSLQIDLSVIGEDIMLARDVINLARFRALEDLSGRVELFRFRKMCDVTV